MWHGQKLLVHVKSQINHVEILPFKIAALNTKTQRMEFFGGPGCVESDFAFVSGSKMRSMAKNNEIPPVGFMSQKGWEVLAEYYRNLQD